MTQATTPRRNHTTESNLFSLSATTGRTASKRTSSAVQPSDRGAGRVTFNKRHEKQELKRQLTQIKRTERQEIVANVSYFLYTYRRNALIGLTTTGIATLLIGIGFMWGNTHAISQLASIDSTKTSEVANR